MKEPPLTPGPVEPEPALRKGGGKGWQCVGGGYYALSMEFQIPFRKMTIYIPVSSGEACTGQAPLLQAVSVDLEPTSLFSTLNGLTRLHFSLES